MTDQNRKTLRSFYCRDYLWELFDQMTHDLGCSMDYLINESMRSYARSRDYAPNENPNPNSGFGGNGQQNFGNNGAYRPPAQAPAQPSFGQGNFGAMEQHRTFDRIPPVGQSQSQPGVQFGSQSASPMPPPPPSPAWQPQPQPQSGSYAPHQPQQQAPHNFSQPTLTGQPPIFLFFNNNRYVVDKEEFIIGRGSQQTDLTIRDGNISRQHCSVVYHNGAYYIKDLGSTNGVEFRGNRIESKKIDEGDVFFLCDYELRFTNHA